MNPILSIIVPVYNVEEYLPKCLDSICNQSFKDFELILVNDGSTDNSYNICNAYSKKDKRIIIVNKQNGGLSSARNAGIELATGEYIGFVDSDDWIDLDMYELLINNIKKNDADIAICNDKKVVNKNVLSSTNTNKVRVYSQEKAIEALIEGVHFQEYAWNKVYKRTLFTDIRFPEEKLYEDVFVMYKLFLKSCKIIHIDSAKYYYLQRNGSILNSCFSIKKMDLIEACEKRHKDIICVYPNFKKKSNIALLNANLDIINQIVLMTNIIDFKNELLELRKNIVNIMKLDLKLTDISIRKVIPLLILLFNLNLYSWTLKRKAKFLRRKNS